MVSVLAVDDMLTVLNPDDGSVVGEVPLSSAADAERALSAGMAALRRPLLPAHERARILNDVADRVARDQEAHAVLIATEGVKTIHEARGEALRAAETLRLSAQEAKRLAGGTVAMDQAPSGAGRTGWWVCRPAGLVVAITPYNDPLNLVAHKLGPAFAVGAPVILKPHPQTPYSALRLVEHFHAAGAPADMIQILIGGGDLGDRLVVDSRPRVISFTGGRQAGGAIARRAGIKRLALELGGVGTVAVAADADLDRAAACIHSGAFWAAGQNCVHAQRIIVDDRMAGPLTERLIALTKAMSLGPKLDDATDMGPMVDKAAATRVAAAIADARQAGARLLIGGEAHGTHVQPTWLAGLSTDHPLMTHEIFGPVATLETVPDDAALLDRLGGAADAIHAGLFTGSLGLTMAAHERVNAAALIVNDSTDFRIDAMPFGGIGAAGLGREGVADAVSELTEKKLMVLRA
ncbi:putative aldehyde-dehydrogenase-like protein y4uC [Sphingosinicella microcystinivorans]|uniref:Aldehyde-dehydrogenase-like protein y4uC n=2 Tax=Sphingosinicella microcystinivorans TaxID=335406 RepID=A0AAD1D8F0_SPHMI|nr:glyceraldehyde-3-phosphate dehydrogenase (NADP+) [Sphingosinicella microcystinivorans]BBE35615.1 putative aldehyde-dehydrogenase-like protein y4uC [Sphingosinicella microcystinivorans]